MVAGETWAEGEGTHDERAWNSDKSVRRAGVHAQEAMQTYLVVCDLLRFEENRRDEE